jgi:peptide/nickel transport system permease protein
MIAYIARRLLFAVLVLLSASLITFTLFRVIPADPVKVAVGVMADRQTIDRYRHRWGLDRPLTSQYFLYMQGLLQGDLGLSLQTQRPVLDDIRRFYPATAELAVAAIVVYIAIGVPLGALAGMTKRRRLDHLVRIAALAAYSMPVFWLGLVLQIAFFGWLQALPAIGRLDAGVPPPPPITGFYVIDGMLSGHWAASRSALTHLILPVTTLALSQIGLLVRLVRVSVLDVRTRLFVATARAKGLSERRVAYKHVLRNAALPVLTTVGIQFGFLLSGTVLVETIFGWPGLGRYAVASITYFDYNPIMAVTLLGTFVFLLINLVVDILYTLLDPRIAYG